MGLTGLIRGGCVVVAFVDVPWVGDDEEGWWSRDRGSVETG